MILTLKVLRAEKQYTITELSNKAGITRGRVNLIEHRNNFETEEYKTLAQLAKAFDMTIEDLIERNKNDHIRSKSSQN